MMWAMRRQLSGVVNIAGRRAAGRRTRPTAEIRPVKPPVGLPVMRPMTSACALIARQSAKARHGVDVGDLLDVGGGIDRREQAAALQIGGDDLRHTVRRYRRSGPARRRNREWRSASAGSCLGDVEAARRRLTRPTARGRRRRARAASTLGDGSRKRIFDSWKIDHADWKLACQPPSSSCGSNLISMSFH